MLGAFIASDGLILFLLGPVKSWAKVVLSIVSKNVSKSRTLAFTI